MLNLSTLNPQQREAVKALHGPVLLLAGAGTGKTRVITCRIAHLIEQGIAPGSVLAVTFTNKAAREMQERVRKMLPHPERRGRSSPQSPSGQNDTSAQDARPTICTFHSLCVRILRQHIEKLGYKRNFVIYDASEQVGVVKKILAQISAKGEKVDAAAVLSLLSRIKNGGERAGMFTDPSARAIAEHIRSRYETALRACNAVDFDDLILLTLKLFNEHPEALAACREKYRYVMVDEYQDTNAAQFKLVHALTLLIAANGILRHYVRRRGKQLWSEKGDGPKITLHSFPSDEEEARNVGEQIEYARLTRRAGWGEHAILFRTNMQSRPLETALRQAGVRYHLIGGQSFFDRREVRDFLAYLKMFVNPHDDVSLLRIANVPARGLSDVTMERLLGASHERKCSVFSAMKNPVVTTTFQARVRESIEGFVQFIERTRSRLAAPPGESAPQLSGSAGLAPAPAGMLTNWAHHLREEIGFFNELRRLEKTAEAAEARSRSLRELMATLDAERPGSPAERLGVFLEEITLDTEREEEDEGPENAVTLITMHSCKGLEFPHVYIVGLEDGLLPHSRSKEEGTLDEERRLFYVAVTRAMQTLTLSHCSVRKKYGLPQPCHPSPFLGEVPEELVERADEKGKQPVAVQNGKSMFDALRATLE